MPEDEPSTQQRWAVFRFSVIAPLLAAPPPRGELAAALQERADQTYQHPIQGGPYQISFSTVERWYYAVSNQLTDPLGALRQKVRSDSGSHPAMPDGLRQALIRQHRDHPTWSRMLHYDNLGALTRKDSTLGRLPSYSTVRRYMHGAGLRRVRRVNRQDTAAARRAEQRLLEREVLSFEAEYVGQLWHTDYHCCSRKVLTASGQWVRPWLLGFLDDHSRLACHAQWYLDVTAANTYHGLVQAICKRGLPRDLMHDNGREFIAAEFAQGLPRLGITPKPTLEHSPYQNGKQETWWSAVEERLLPMLEGCRELTLEQLNRATQAWVELEYNREPHRELGDRPPLERFTDAPSVMRDAPTLDQIRLAIGVQQTRKVRRGDGTIQLHRRRFEIPNSHRHMNSVTLRFARWDLSFVHMVDPRTDAVLCRIFPQDKAANADGKRRALSLQPEQERPTSDDREAGMAPLLQELIERAEATGLPPAYWPQPEKREADTPDNNTIDEEDRL